MSYIDRERLLRFCGLHLRVLATSQLKDCRFTFEIWINDRDCIVDLGVDGAPIGIIQEPRRDARSRIMHMPVMCVRPVCMSVDFFVVCVLMNMRFLKGIGMFMAMVNILVAM